MHYYFCITKQVILDVCCRLLPWKLNKMATKQQINNSSLYKTLCIYNFFDNNKQINITIPKLCQKVFVI